jgi:drug/metabolite transporter (DMT)-like permease
LINGKQTNQAQQMTQQSINRPILGATLVVSGMLIIGFIDNFIKEIAEDAGLWQFHFMRAAIICATVLVLAQVFRWRLAPRNWPAVALRSLFFSISMVLYFGAAGMLPIAEVGAGLFLSPIFVLLVSIGFLNLRVGIWRILAVGLGFSGVLVILRPDPNNLSILTFIPIIAGFFYALCIIATRRWCEGETTLTLLVGAFGALGIWGLAGLVFFSFFTAPPELADLLPFFTMGWVAVTPKFMFWLFVQAYGSLAAVWLLTRGYQMGEVSFISVFEYSFLVFAAFWAWILWGETMDLAGTIGVIAIILSGVIIALRSR